MRACVRKDRDKDRDIEKEDRNVVTTSKYSPLVVAEAGSTQALAQLWKENITARVF